MCSKFHLHKGGEIREAIQPVAGRRVGWRGVELDQVVGGFRNPKQRHLGCINLVKEWEKLSRGAGFLNHQLHFVMLTSQKLLFNVQVDTQYFFFRSKPAGSGQGFSPSCWKPKDVFRHLKVTKSQ